MCGGTVRQTDMWLVWLVWLESQSRALVAIIDHRIYVAVHRSEN